MSNPRKKPTASASGAPSTPVNAPLASSTQNEATNTNPPDAPAATTTPPEAAPPAPPVSPEQPPEQPPEAPADAPAASAPPADTNAPPEPPADPEPPKLVLLANQLDLPAEAQDYLTYIETRWGQKTVDPKVKALILSLVDYETTMTPSAPLPMDILARQQLALRNAYLGAMVDKTNMSKIIRFMLVCYMLTRNPEMFTERTAFRGLIPPYFPTETATEFRLVLTTLLTYLKIGTHPTTTINIARAADALPAGYGGVDVRAEFLALLAHLKKNRPTA